MRGGREAILKAAIEVFARHGYAGSSIRAICQAAGVTKPVLYYYFRSKEHLYQELMIDCFSISLKTLLRASQSAGSLRQRLVRIVWDDFLSVKKAPVRAQFLLRMIFSPEGQRPYFDYIRESERQRRTIAGVIQEGIDTGELSGNAKDLATALMGMDLMAILEGVLTGRATLTRRAAERNVDLLLNGCTIA
jgi:TetR/AcrR family transcriptional regulator